MAHQKKKKALWGIRQGNIKKFGKNFSDIFSAIALKIAPFFDAWTAMPPRQRVGISILIPGLVVVGFYMFFHKPQTERLAGLARDLEQTDLRILKAQKILPELKALEEKKGVKELFLQEAMDALPKNYETPSFLSDISIAGKQAGLMFLSFKSEKEIMKDFYAEIPVSLEMSGDFHHTVIFLDSLARMPHLVNVRNIAMQSRQGKEDNTLEMRTRCQIVTYRFVEWEKP